ncbi:MAG TPA: Ig-like domain-containing protein, partial [Rhodothermales bacterium]
MSIEPREEAVMKRGLFYIAMMALAAMPARANTLAVVASSPADGSSSVGIEATVTFTFNLPVDPELIPEAILAEPANSLVMGDFEVSEDGHTVRVDVTHQPGTDYVWIVSGAHEDVSDDIVVSIDPYVLRYTTGSTPGNIDVKGRVTVRG